MKFITSPLIICFFGNVMCYELSTEKNESYFIRLDSFCSNETCDEQ